mmetsp:Transcript_30933/g.77368  ORF Transcript_30933/g.77368 Transcript_30933/m.77368 type:complete len:251 (-) Transcript_30933:88-840(-)
MQFTISPESSKSTDISAIPGGGAGSEGTTASEHVAGAQCSDASGLCVPSEPAPRVHSEPGLRVPSVRLFFKTSGGTRRHLRVLSKPSQSDVSPQQRLDSFPITAYARLTARSVRASVTSAGPTSTVGTLKSCTIADCGVATAAGESGRSPCRPTAVRAARAHCGVGGGMRAAAAARRAACCAAEGGGTIHAVPGGIPPPASPTPPLPSPLHSPCRCCKRPVLPPPLRQSAAGKRGFRQPGCCCCICCSPV